MQDTKKTINCAKKSSAIIDSNNLVYVYEKQLHQPKPATNLLDALRNFPSVLSDELQFVNSVFSFGYSFSK